MILALYRELGELAEEHLVVLSEKVIFLPSGEPQKLRINLVDATILDVWISLTGKYSYHWDRRIIQKGIYRFDNAPHERWKSVKSYPRHFHNGDEENVIESDISAAPRQAINQVLFFIIKILLDEQKQ